MRWSNSHLPAVLYTRRGEHWQTDPRRTGRVGMIINSTSVSLEGKVIASPWEAEDILEGMLPVSL